MIRSAPGTLGIVCLLLAAGCGSGGSVAIGGACAADADCQSGSCAATFPGGGYCRGLDCNSCPGGSSCGSFQGTQACYQSCSGPEQCRGSDYQCFNGVCVPKCASGDDCGPGFKCNQGSGQCEQATATRCNRDVNCASGVCLLPEQLCSDTCARTADCQGGWSCIWRGAEQNGVRTDVREVCSPNNDGKLELGAACAGNAGCRSGYCHLGVCSQACASDDGCSNGLSCVGSQEPMPNSTSHATKACLPPSGMTTWDLSSYPAIYKSVVPVPDNAVSFSIVTTTSSAANMPVVTSLTDPSGNQEASIGLDPWDPRVHVRLDPQNAINTMMVPMTNKYPLIHGGAYTFGTGIFSSSTGAAIPGIPGIQLVYKLAPGARVSSGTLNLNIHILPMRGHACSSGTTMSANTAPSILSRDIATMRRIYAKAGITLGTINYFDLNRTDLQSIDGTQPGALDPLFSASAGHNEHAVNVFLVRSLSGGSTSFALLGVSGGIPGSLTPGTVHSGVVVTFEAYCAFTMDGSSIIGNVMSHESGHYLGLWHNVEQNGQGGNDPTHQDLLDDTTTSSSNLMYWNEQGGEDLSQGQGFVMRNNTLVE